MFVHCMCQLHNPTYSWQNLPQLLFTPHAPPGQVPRLTAVLRALTTEHGKAFDADAAYIQRQQLLRRRLQAQPGQGAQAGAAGLGKSRLAQQLLGDWAAGEGGGGKDAARMTYSKLCCCPGNRRLMAASMWWGCNQSSYKEGSRSMGNQVVHHTRRSVWLCTAHLLHAPAP
jgi:hypothetical protein